MMRLVSQFAVNASPIATVRGIARLVVDLDSDRAE